MNDRAGSAGRLVRRTLLICVRGLEQTLASLAGLPMFFVSVLCVLTLAAGIGVLLAPKSLLAVRRLASRQRVRTLESSGVQIDTPYRPRPVEVTNGLIGRMQRCKWVLTDPATWRDLLWELVNVPVSVVLGLLPAFMVFAGVWVLTVDCGNVLCGWWTNAAPSFWPQVFWLSLLPLSVVVGPWLPRAHAQVTSSLLAPTRNAMAARVDQLAQSRSQAVDTSAAELRRIERDLHDGAQARLVALGMNIGFAEQILRKDPDLALSLLAEARESSGQALTELRTLVRGIHPPVLAERGLDGAVRALALSLPLPVDLHIDLTGRASAPVESALYFAIAEALANVVKHSGANRAWVQLEYDSGRVIAIVGDNGTGGATLRSGGGLRGVERRLAAFDGVTAVTSPVGGPTLVTMELPCELSLARI
jgi:signal transduction histidine kinase